MAPGTTTLPAIFAVDDDEFDRDLLRRALKSAGIDNPLTQFRCGEEMLDALLEVLRGASPPLVCFIDVKMNGMTGLDVLRWIRAQDRLRGIPVVMLSSSDAPPLLAEALQVGAQCYVAKFPGADELRAILEAAEQFTSATMASGAFSLRCNLLVAERTAAR